MMRYKVYQNFRCYGCLLLAQTCLIVLLANSSIAAARGFSAYNEARLTEALNYFENGYADSIEALFLQAALTSDAEAAVEIYKQIVLQNPETEIAERSLDRIRQYYYAQGLYTRAGEIEKTLGNWKLTDKRLRKAETTPPPPILLSAALQPISAQKMPVIDPEPTSAPVQITEKPVVKLESPPVTRPQYAFALQVGAFSRPSNAETFEEKFEKAGYQVEVTSPSQNGTNLHIVRVVGYDTVEQAFAASEKIQKEFKITPIVVPF
ncbi:SPOR domain-containing protein [bacterium]|nr:SPOR domain-containing protein [bacterium]MBU1651381.1 SPOR domain-containing protein [bacterium]MBU1882233.1 SPOR domain-containing protein [bacterium]